MGDTGDFASRLSAALAARDRAAVDLSKESYDAFQEIWAALDGLDEEIKQIVPKAGFKRAGGPEQAAQGLVEVKYHAQNGEGLTRPFNFLIKDAELITFEGIPANAVPDEFIDTLPAVRRPSARTIVDFVERELIAWLAAPRPKRVVQLWD